MEKNRFCLTGWGPWCCSWPVFLVCLPLWLTMLLWRTTKEWHQRNGYQFMRLLTSLNTGLRHMELNWLPEPARCFVLQPPLWRPWGSQHQSVPRHVHCKLTCLHGAEIYWRHTFSFLYCPSGNNIDIVYSMILYAVLYRCLLEYHWRNTNANVRSKKH